MLGGEHRGEPGGQGAEITTSGDDPHEEAHVDEQPGGAEEGPGAGTGGHRSRQKGAPGAADQEDRQAGQEEDAGDLRTVTLGGRVRTIVPASRRYGGQIISLAWARPPAGTRYRAPQRDDGVFASAPVSALAADGDRVGYAACMNVSAWRPSTGDLRGVEVPDGDMCYASVRGEIDGLAMAGE